MSTPKQSYYLINKGIKNWWCVLFYFLSKQKKFLKLTQNLYMYRFVWILIQNLRIKRNKIRKKNERENWWLKYQYNAVMCVRIDRDKKW